MSERMSAWIAIGGSVPRALVPELCRAIGQQQLSRDWGGDTFVPEDEDDLTDALDHGGQLFLCDDEARWGQFDTLEKFLREHSISYDRHSSANWGQVGSERGGRTAAVLYTMVATCKHLGIDPFAYLREALPGLYALGETPAAEQLLDWLPDRWLLRRGRDSPAAAVAAG